MREDLVTLDILFGTLSNYESFNIIFFVEHRVSPCLAYCKQFSNKLHLAEQFLLNLILGNHLSFTLVSLVLLLVLVCHTVTFTPGSLLLRQ